ncbi:putative membrane protein YesL [Evansella vedderi]|uniref:Membrane protein YesL n=1 Tax=Evansella vedderi TaxID=38282 RepID=A0ABT9ZPU6_9BACI|nr:YesL family protein [Evansella vedderi]MDQ0253260.1 putative membrane protein YesL [Evansella vedderi]
MLDDILSKVNHLGEWVVRLTYLNLLWILFSVLGLVIFGVFPATSAMFTVIRTWSKKDQVPVFDTFLKEYKKSFFKVNILAGFLLVIGIFIYIDFIFLGSMEGTVFTVLNYILIAIAFVYISILFYIFPVYVHYDLKNFEYIKYAFIMSISYPHLTILMLIGSIVLIATFITFPLLFVLFLGSSHAALIMYISNRAFQKVEKKAQAVI